MMDPVGTLTRRRLLEFGGSLLSLNLGGLWQAQAASRPSRSALATAREGEAREGEAREGEAPAEPSARPIRSCILIFCYGGPSQLDTFDLKPNAPEVRGEFRPIATSVPGLQICEHLPRLAGLMHHAALVRTVT